MTRPPAALRRQVIERARQCCEYCLVHQELVASAHQVDHVVAEKHGGETVLGNLALSCSLCNRRKGSDLTSVDPEMGGVVALFNPRTQLWRSHFRIDGPRIAGTTAVGRTTVVFLRLNSLPRLLERAEWARASRFPPEWL